MDDAEEVALVGTMFSMIYLMYVQARQAKQRINRRWWVRDIYLDRICAGYYVRMFKKMKASDPEQFFKHTRMDRPVYDLLLSLVKEKLTKKSIRPSIEFECRLAITLSYLSEGVSHQYLAWSFHMGKSTVREIILETCDVLWEVLSSVYVTAPNAEDFKEISEDFWTTWNMPNCVGAVDGKHINIQCPPKTGSMYFNYKKTFSIVLMATCDAKYRFTYVDVGAYGSQSDGGIFQNSAMGQALLRGQLPLPPDRCLPNSIEKMPYFFVGDAAFPLKEHIMRPFPGQLLDERRRIYNYRLSRARRTIENTFGILVARWRILKTTINSLPSNCEKIVLGCVALHNFILFNSTSTTYCPRNYVDWEDENGKIQSGEWRQEVEPLRQARVGSNNATRNAFRVRDTLANYFVNEGAVPFQYDLER